MKPTVPGPLRLILPLGSLAFAVFTANCIAQETPPRVQLTGSLSPFPLFGNGSIRVGTFNPSFDPFSYKFAYGIDSVGNMDSPNYTRAVGDGVFRQLGAGQFQGWSFDRTISINQAAGQQMWVFVFNHSNPDDADLFALFTGSTPGWLTPASGLVSLSANSADTFVFGSGGRGGLIEVQILPIPEPRTIALLSVGLIAAGAWRLGSRKR